MSSVQALLEMLENFKRCSGLELKNRSNVVRFLSRQEGHTSWVSLAGRMCVCTEYSLI